MEVTFLGYILIPLGLIIKSNNLIFYLYVFFLPFGASSILNVESITFGLQPSYYFMIILIMRKIFFFLINKKFMVTKIEIRNLFFLCFLLAIIVLSIFILSLDLFSIKVHYPGYEWGEFHLVGLNRLNITQFMYILFVFLSIIVSVNYLKSEHVLYNSFFVILASTIFTFIWGVYQAVCYYGGFEYMDYIFNNNIGLNLDGWNQSMFGLKRISSVSTEPSKYAFYLSQIFAFLFTLWLYDIKFIKMQNMILYFTILFLFLTTSTTAILVFFVMLFYISLLTFTKKIFFVNRKKNVQRLFSMYILIIGSFLALFYLITLVVDQSVLLKSIDFILFDKTSTQSSYERSQGFLMGLQILFDSYLLGVGWGSNRSFDILTTISSNIGIIGLGGFIAYIWYTIKIDKKVCSYYYYGVFQASKNALIAGLIVLIISVPDLIYLHFWFFLSVLISLKVILQKHKASCKE